MGMSAQDVVAAVARIAEEKYDDESAHADEDSLYLAILRQVAADAPDPWKTLAAEALKTQEINFERWCA